MTAFRTITVRDLRKLLKGEDDDTLVVFSTDYGERQALPLVGNTELVTIEESVYSNSGFSIVDADDDQDPDEETYLLIS